MTTDKTSLNVYATKADSSPIERDETEAHSHENEKSDATIERSIGVSGDVDSALPTLKLTKSGVSREPCSEERIKNVFIGDLTEAEETHFVTGSSYKGSWDALGMAGVGRYVMPNGAAYEGEIRDGMFHGHGSIYWSKNQRLDVVHLRGVLQEHRYTFGDGLAHEDKDWSYCKFPDRRFYESVKKGLRPGGKTLKTGKRPTKVLPSGCYDTGDGVFDPKTLRITSYDDSTKVLRVPDQEEYDWIIKNCRRSWTEPTGYRPSLNENWSDNPPDLPYHIAMSEDSPDSWWKRLTTFKRHFDARSEDDQDSDTPTQENEPDLPKLCLCGQYVILGRPCNCAETVAVSDHDCPRDDLDIGSQSARNSLDHSEARNLSREKVKNTREAQDRSSQNEQFSAEGLEVDIDHLSRASGKFSTHYFSEEHVEDYMESVRRLEPTIEASIAEKSVSKEKIRQGHEISNEELMNKLEEIAAKENEGAADKESRITHLILDNAAASASIREEKVSAATEPEASNGRRPETKLLPKATTNERDLPYDRASKVEIRSAAALIPVIRETQQENTVYRTFSNGNPTNLAVNVSTGSPMAGEKKSEDATNDGNFSNTSSENSSLPFDEAEAGIDAPGGARLSHRRDKSVIGPGEKSTYIDPSRTEKYADMSKKQFLEHRRDEFSARKVHEEKRHSSRISTFSSVAASRVTSRKDSESSGTTDEDMTTETSFASVKNDRQVLEQLQRSLAVLPCKTLETRDEKAVIEIYNNFSKKQIPKCLNRNVWRLSGATQYSDPQSKMEGLFDPTLSTRRREMIEYMRKPCSVKPTSPEVQTSASRCRKEFPFDIPAKSCRSTIEQRVHRKQ